MNEQQFRHGELSVRVIVGVTRPGILRPRGVGRCRVRIGSCHHRGNGIDCAFRCPASDIAQGDVRVERSAVQPESVFKQLTGDGLPHAGKLA